MEYRVTTKVVGNGSIQTHRYGTDNNDIDVSVIPSANHHFTKYVIYGIDTVDKILSTHLGEFITTVNGKCIVVRVLIESTLTDTPLILHADRDIAITAYFEEDDKFTIYASANILHAHIYISHNHDYAGYNASVFARPFPGYYFVRWTDDVTANPREFYNVDKDITIIAEYQKIAENNEIYQYRCFVKDQLNLTAPPKAFMVADTFDVKRDFLTNATSIINVLEISENINNGDILVLYDPQGTILYEGVITSVETNQITCSQMQSFYKGLWLYNVHPSSTIEQEVAWLLGQYASGHIYKSSYVDSLVAKRLGGITIDYTGSTIAKLPTDLDKDGNEQLTEKDMEQFIYQLYEDYNIIFDFEINFEGANYVHIKVPTFEKIKVGNNMYAVQDMSPITTIEETNKLIIFSKEKVYRTTYVATKNGIVENPSSIANRFDITNTKVVYSDDDVSDLVANNLPQQMFNHKLTFNLVTNNFIYEFGDFNLGGELDIYYGDDYYNSVLTGYEITKESNKNITSVYFVCGKVRTKLTQLLTLGKV